MLTPGERELLKLIDGRSTHLPNVKESQNKTGLTQRAIEAYNQSQEALEGSVVDDGVPPANPAGAAVSTGVRSLIVSWAPPAVTDHVHHTVVTVEAPPGTVIQTKNVVGTSVSLVGLTAGTSYTVKIKHVDIWSLESGVVTAGTGTPTVSVADEVDLAAANIIGELGYDNIETLTAALAALKVDADAITGTHIADNSIETGQLAANAVTAGKIAANTITAGQLAAGDAAFLNAWIQDAAIANAKIASLSADKITAGSIDVALSVTAGGYIDGGGTRISDTGIRLKDSALVENSFPAETGDWITPTPKGGSPTTYAGLGFFYDDTSVTRGVVIRASGAGGFARQGRVIISADEGFQGTNDISTAKVRLESAAAGIGKVKLQGQVQLTGTPATSPPAIGLFMNDAPTSIGSEWSQDVAIRAWRMDRLVHLRGRLTNSSGDNNGSGAPCFTLPPEYRPDTFKYVVGISTTSGVYTENKRIVIESGGQVHLAENDGSLGDGLGNTVKTGQKLSFDGVSFIID